MKYIRTLVSIKRFVQHGASRCDEDAAAKQGSLDIVWEEMRHRVADQDAQAVILATKASFLFTAGSTVLGASAAFATLLVNDADIRKLTLTLPALVGGGAYVWLTVCFVMAYRIRKFRRVPAPKRLKEYSTYARMDSLRKITDGRRFAIEENERQLNCIACWVNQELVCLMMLSASALVALVASGFA